MKLVTIQHLAQEQSRALDLGTYGPSDDLILTINDGTEDGWAVRGHVMAYQGDVMVRRRFAADGNLLPPFSSAAAAHDRTSLEDGKNAGVIIAADSILAVRWGVTVG